MSVSSSKTRASLFSEFVELLSSMRFAVSLLSFVCVASVIGTVLPQNADPISYLNKFGAFWTEVFDKLSLFQVYNAWWFLVVMGFLVTSTSLCLIKNTPKMLKDMRTFRDHLRENSLNAFPHKLSYTTSLPLDEQTNVFIRLLKHLGYQVKTTDKDGAKLISAKKGSYNRLGYIFAHGAIILVCVGGLLDSELQLKLQLLFLGKTPVGNMALSEVPDTARLSIANPSFRANMLLPESSSSNYAVVRVDDQFLLQPLPFSMKLNEFVVDYYSTGMPKNFASLVTVTDPDTGETFDATIRVNHPLKYKGVTVYQSSFDDGGSILKFDVLNVINPEAVPFPMEMRVGASRGIENPNDPTQAYKIDLLKFSPINVETIAKPGQGDSVEKRFQDHVASVTDSALGGIGKNQQNVGPMFVYRLTDSAGQATEFKNYMLPVDVDGQAMFLLGVRSLQDPDFKYVRIPADEQASTHEFFSLRSMLSRPEDRSRAIEAYLSRTQMNADQTNGPQLRNFAKTLMDVFADKGLQGVELFIQTNIPEQGRAQVNQVSIKMIAGVVHELRQLNRQAIGWTPLNPETESQQIDQALWLQQALYAHSSLSVYPSPVILTLNTFDEIKASVFQVARSPGTWLVYIGSVFLVLGVFAMFYIRERRIWIWVKSVDHVSHSALAMSATRRTLDFENEFNHLKSTLDAALKKDDSQ